MLIITNSAIVSELKDAEKITIGAYLVSKKTENFRRAPTINSKIVFMRVITMKSQEIN